MIRWRRDPSSKSVEFVTDIPNPIEEEFPLKLRLTVFDLLSSDEREAKPRPGFRFRAHASFNGNELFRLYAPTVEDAQKQIEDGLRKVFTALVNVTGREYEPEELCNVCMVPEHDTCANNPVCPCCRDSMREP